MASVSITDNQDGSGITVTAEGYSEAILWAAPFTGKHSTAAFQPVVTLTEDGSEPVSLPEGPYFAVWQLDGSFAAPTAFRVSDGTPGLHQRCLVALREFILSLSLPGYPENPAMHKLHKKPIRSITEFGDRPHGVHYWKTDDSLRLADNSRNSVTYPIQIALIRGNEGNNVADGDWTLSRQIVIQSFPRCPLPDVPEIHTVQVVPSVLYYDSGSLNLDLQSLIFRCVTELPAIL